MRDWQVGDPVGDGNDIGVPDTRYMGYLKDRDGNSQGTLVDEFKNDYANSFDFFKLNHEEDAFMMLESAFRIYNEMSDHERSQISYNPFNRDWVIELCCRIANMHGGRVKSAVTIIMQNRGSAKICRACDMIYSYYHESCGKCGKPLENLNAKTPEELGEEIYGAIGHFVFDEARKQRLVEESVKLMKSNDCRLVSFQRAMDYGIDFVFEKPHRFFTTTYLCEYNPQYMGPLAFEDFSIVHNHDDLLSDGRFSKLVRETENETGFKFTKCSGGYGAKLDYGGYGFTFTDEIDVTVSFDMGDGRYAVYDLDLKNMKLEKEYRVYE